MSREDELPPDDKLPSEDKISPNDKILVHLENREHDGAKLVSPSAERNCGPIGEVLSPLIPHRGSVLEIASGTGQHGAHMCALRPDIHWKMSDIDAVSRASQDAHARDFRGQISRSMHVDMTKAGWWRQVGSPDVIYCANMIHIAPWEATIGLVNGASALSGAVGAICLYGPFLRGEDNAQSNLDFDTSLKRRSPMWGVRNLEAVKHIFADGGLELASAIEMPRNNLFLVFKPA